MSGAERKCTPNRAQNGLLMKLTIRTGDAQVNERTFRLISIPSSIDRNQSTALNCVFSTIIIPPGGRKCDRNRYPSGSPLSLSRSRPLQLYPIENSSFSARISRSARDRLYIDRLIANFGRGDRVAAEQKKIRAQQRRKSEAALSLQFHFIFNANSRPLDGRTLQSLPLYTRITRLSSTTASPFYRLAARLLV